MLRSSEVDSATRDWLYAQVTMWVGQSLRRFEVHDESALRRRDVHEWACTFRLAVYLDRLVEDAASAGGYRWDVDIEYNRQGHDQATKTGPDGPIRPDIIIHRRGRGEVQHNLLFLEIKRCWHGTGDADDLRKVAAAVRGEKPDGERLKYQYRFGAVLGLWTHDEGPCPRDPARRRFDPHWILLEEDGPGRSKPNPPSRAPMPRS